MSTKFGWFIVFFAVSYVAIVYRAKPVYLPQDAMVEVHAGIDDSYATYSFSSRLVQHEGRIQVITNDSPEAKAAFAQKAGPELTKLSEKLFADCPAIIGLAVDQSELILTARDANIDWRKVEDSVVDWSRSHGAKDLLVVRN